MGIFGDYRFLSAGNYTTALLCFVLSILVLCANPRSRSCQLVFSFNFFVAIWAFFYATMFLGPTEPLATLSCRIFTVATNALNVFFTHFVLVAVKKEKRSKNFLIFNYSSTALLSLLVFTHSFIIAGAPPKLDFPFYIDGGSFYFLIPIQLFANVIYSSYELIQGIRKTKGYRKSQLSLFLIGILIGYVAGTPGYLLAFNIPVKPITTPLVSLFPVFLTYTIIKHRFLDVRKLFKNTLIFSLLFVFLLGVASIVLFVFKEGVSRWVGISEALAQGIAIALAIGFYGPLKAGLSKLTNQLLFQHAQNPETIFTKLSEDIIHYLNVKKLANEVTSRIADILALERIGFYARDKMNRSLFELQASVGSLRKKQIHQSKQLVQYLERTKDPLVSIHTERESRELSRKKSSSILTNLKEIKEQAEIELAALGGVAAFPVFVKDALHAILIAGRKKSDASWTDEEFQILKSFMRHLAFALANSEYAEEIMRSRERLSLSERDASAGALIAGVDHEVKNPIHAMSLQLGTLSANLSDARFLTEPHQKLEETVQKTMTNIRSGIIEINNVIEHLSDLADKKPLRIEEGVRPREIAERVIHDLGRDGSLERIKISLRIPEPLSIPCDSNALYEILVNLVRNAEQAIPEKGEITIDGRNSEHGLVIEVCDTGTGISKERMTRIFEPFFTTKRKPLTPSPLPLGEGRVREMNGTGMGLFIAREYMRNMGGTITVESEVGKGTKFRLGFYNSESSLRRVA